MVATLPFFTIDLPHKRSEFEALRRLGEYEKLENNIYRWTFPLPNLREVEVALGGVPVVVDKGFLVDHILPLCEPLMKELELETEAKGKGKFTVFVEDSAYRIVWFQRGKEKSWVVSKSIIDHIWYKVLSEFVVGENVKTPVLEEKIVRSLEKHHWDDILLPSLEEDKKVQDYITQGRWNYQKSGEFNYKYFNGDRTNYFHLYYYPMKCLQALELIKFGSGVTKLCKTSEFVSQVRVQEIELMKQEQKEKTVLDTAEDMKVWEHFTRMGGQTRFNAKAIK